MERAGQPDFFSPFRILTNCRSKETEQRKIIVEGYLLTLWILVT